MNRLLGSSVLRAAIVAAVFAASATPLLAQETIAPVPANVNPLTRKLLEVLIAKGILTTDQAQQLVREAQAEQGAAPTAGPSPATSSHTVPYIPEPVRQQIKDELRKEMLTQAEAEGWAAPQASPEWAKRISLFGDVRVRGEAIQLSELNDTQQLNFNSINAGSGYDIRIQELPPFINTTQDRQRARIRGRFGIAAKQDDWISAGLRIATGSDRSPVSTNQTLGADGEFSKYSLWLDRAYVRLSPLANLAIDFGRSENPFWSTDLIFDDDLNFDGVSLNYRPSSKGASVFGSLGGFPIYNTAFNFGSTSEEKTKSRDKYLLAAQLGFNWVSESNTSVKVAAGYFDFSKIEGEVSSPCLTDIASGSCDTDISRPLFVQSGNTLFGIRTITFPVGTTDPNTVPQRQYFGLASQFKVADAHVAFDLNAFKPVRIRIEADYARNLAFDEQAIEVLDLVNNFSADDPNTTTVDESEWQSGDTAWMAKVIVGHPQIDKRGAWSFSVAYKHIEGDSVPDGFNDSDFRLGGTNAKGFVATADVGIGKNTGVGFRWYSADEITGPPLSVEVLHLDLTTRF